MIRPQVIVIVPCYNEAHRLPQQDFIQFVDFLPGYDFLFVDDGSADQTREVLKGLQAQRPERFRYLSLEKNSGKAEAVRRGFLEAMNSGAPFLAFWDADLATPLEVLPHFLHLVEERPQIQIVMGARVKLMGHEIQRHWLRHYLG